MRRLPGERNWVPHFPCTQPRSSRVDLGVEVKGQDLSEEQRNEAAILVFGLTLGDHSLQPDDVDVVELSNNWSLTQKLSLLLFPLAGSQRLYRDSDVHPSRHVQPTTTDFSKFTCQSETACHKAGIKSINVPVPGEVFSSCLSLVALKYQMNTKKQFENLYEKG